MADCESNDGSMTYILSLVLYHATEMSILDVHGSATLIGLAIGE